MLMRRRRRTKRFGSVPNEHWRFRFRVVHLQSYLIKGQKSFILSASVSLPIECLRALRGLNPTNKSRRPHLVFKGSICWALFFLLVCCVANHLFASCVLLLFIILWFSFQREIWKICALALSQK
jgi:hypothetical protein